MELTEIRSIAAQLRRISLESSIEYLEDCINSVPVEETTKLTEIQLELAKQYVSARRFKEAFGRVKALIKRLRMGSRESREGQPELVKGVAFLVDLASKAGRELPEVLVEVKRLLESGEFEVLKEQMLSVLKDFEVETKVYKLPEGLEEDNDNILKMVRWIEEGGGSMDALEVRFYSSVYRGVFLKQDAEVSPMSLKKWLNLGFFGLKTKIFEDFSDFLSRKINF